MTGAGSRWTQSGLLAVGEEGSGSLNVGDGGAVTSIHSFIGRKLGSTGTVTVSGADSRWDVSTLLYIGGTHSESGGSGTLNIHDSGLVTVTDTTKLWDEGTINLDGGTLATDSLELTAGTFNMLAGILRTNNVTGSLNNQGGMVAPGHSPAALAISGDYTQGAAATLEIELGGTVRGNEYDALIVSGDVTLAGTLDVLAIGGVVPQAGDLFDILDFAPANLIGSFSVVNLPVLAAGLAWDQTSLYTSGNLLVSAASFDPCGLGGDAGCNTDDLDALYAVMGTSVPPTNSLFDLNMDDVINTADLDEWLSLAATANGYSSAYLRGDTELDRDIDLSDYNTLATNFDPSGTYGPYLWQDGNFDGDDNIDLSDYNALASNFQPLGYGAAAVPEPASALLALLALLLFTTSYPQRLKNSGCRV